MAPVRGTKPKVGRYPLVPQRVEGEEMEPSGSLDPMAKATHPDAVAEADPADEPLEPWSVFHGFPGPATEPFVAHGQGAEGQFGYEDSAGFV